MSNGFGGVLAAPIWHDFMSSASGGYCGDWTPPATPFVGTAFLGPHSATSPGSLIGNGAPSTTTKRPKPQAFT